MKKLLLIRHAKSDWSHEGMKDHDRPLSARGLRDAPRMAAQMAGRAFRPDKVISSSATRALQTVAYFMESWQYADSGLLINPQIYEAWGAHLPKIINELDDQWQQVVLVGHNPGFTDLANRYQEEPIPNIPTCGIVLIQGNVDRWVDFDFPAAQVKSFWYPKQLFPDAID